MSDTRSLEDIAFDDEQAYERGRLDVYREIAVIDPWAYAPGPDECHFCKARQPMHEDGCLWLRALEAITHTCSQCLQPCRCLVTPCEGCYAHKKDGNYILDSLGRLGP